MSREKGILDLKNPKKMGTLKNLEKMRKMDCVVIQALDEIENVTSKNKDLNGR